MNQFYPRRGVIDCHSEIINATWLALFGLDEKIVEVMEIEKTNGLDSSTLLDSP